MTLMLCVTAVAGCDKFRHFLAEEPWKWSASRVAETARRGRIISDALEAYRAKVGTYPVKLSNLQPEFLRDIPQPTVGYKQWEYDLIGTNYWLRVLASEFGPQLQKTNTSRWEYADDHGVRDI